MKEKLAGMGKKLGRFRYPILILLLGILLLALPGKTSRAQPEAPEQTESTGLTIQEARLESLLSQIQGAGQVRVLLSLQTGEQTQYQTGYPPPGGWYGGIHRAVFRWQRQSAGAGAAGIRAAVPGRGDCLPGGGSAPGEAGAGAGGGQCDRAGRGSDHSGQNEMIRRRNNL